MLGFGLIDGIIPEPIGGAHWDYNEAAALVKPVIVQAIQELKNIPEDRRINDRIEKFTKMGFWNELPEQSDVIQYGEQETEIIENISVNHE